VVLDYGRWATSRSIENKKKRKIKYHSFGGAEVVQETQFFFFERTHRASASPRRKKKKINKHMKYFFSFQAPPPMSVCARGHRPNAVVIVVVARSLHGAVG
jgi:hypothetical protein